MVELSYSIIPNNAIVSSKILSLLTKLAGGRGGGGGDNSRKSCRTLAIKTSAHRSFFGGKLNVAKFALFRVHLLVLSEVEIQSEN